MYGIHLEVYTFYFKQTSENIFIRNILSVVTKVSVL